MVLPRKNLCLRAILVLTALVAPCRASVLIDDDAALMRWVNDEDSVLRLRRQGVTREVGRIAPYATPLGPDGRLRFTPCGPPGSGSPVGCERPADPPGERGLVLEIPLDAATPAVFRSLWQRALIHRTFEERNLALAMRTASLRLAGDSREGLNLSSSREAFQPVLEALAAAGQQGPAGGIRERAQRAVAMFAVFEDLWRQKNLHEARDFSMPCHVLQAKLDAFHAAAGSDAVRLQRRRPSGICLFCGNVCTLESADRLLIEMKRATADLLARGADDVGGEVRPKPRTDPTSP